MPALKNQRWEQFAQAMAKGKSADEAYQDAGYSANRGNACRLKASESVMKRVAELQGRAADRTEVTVASLIEKAEEARSLAMATKQPAAAVSAIKEMGVLAGVRIEKRENTNRSLNELSDDELARIALGGGEDAAGETARPSKPH